MGSNALSSSGVTRLFLYLIKDRNFVPHDEPLKQVRTSRVWLWLVLELVG